MRDKDSNEVFDIKCQKCTQCGSWYATCRAVMLGMATQWGQSEIEAMANLKKYVVGVWGQEWP